MDNSDQVNIGWNDLRVVDSRDVRLALAAMNALDHYFEQQQEPVKSTLHVLRNLILSRKNVTERWLYGMPFYYSNSNRFCYLWVHKKLKKPYLGIVDGKMIDHPDLLKEKRSRMKILLVDPAKDVPVKKINSLLGDVPKLC